MGWLAIKLQRNHWLAMTLSSNLAYTSFLTLSGERMCILLVNHLEDLAFPVKVWLGKLTVHVLIPLGWLDHKTSPQTKRYLTQTSVLHYLCMQTVKIQISWQSCSLIVSNDSWIRQRHLADLQTGLGIGWPHMSPMAQEMYFLPSR